MSESLATINIFIATTLGILATHWNIRPDRLFWHAYGLRLEKRSGGEKELRAALFVQSRVEGDQLHKNLFDELKQALSHLHETPPYDPFELVIMSPFRDMHSGSQFLRSVPQRPGARVFTTSDQCGTGCFGTIGGFLRPPGASTNDPAWLLSNHHILAEDENCVKQKLSQVFGSGGVFLSKEIKYIHLDENGVNDVDAAIAKITELDNLTGVYPGIDICCPQPMPLGDGMELKKLGNATNVTSGIALWYASKAVTVSCNGDSFEFQNQIVIGSKSEEEPFLAHGDSGSLVIGEKHPVGLLFAIGSGADLPSEVEAIATPPLGLATPFGTVLEELAKIPSIGSLQLVLASGSVCCTSSQIESAKNDCAAYLELISLGSKASDSEQTSLG